MRRWSSPTRLTLTGLAPGVTYYYRVTSADAAANSATLAESARVAAQLHHAVPVVRRGPDGGGLPAWGR